MPEELEALLAATVGRRTSQEGGFELHAGRLEQRDVLVARCGIGKVNAAALAQLLVMRRPRCLVFTGVAGACDPELRVGDIVVATSAVQHDVDVTALGYERGRVPGEPLEWRCDDLLVEHAIAAASEAADVRVVRGRVASGDQFVADAERTARLREEFQASCVEMEGAAVAQVCSRSGTPFVIVRSISDSADHAAEVSFRAFTVLAAERAKQVVRGFLRRL